MKWWLLQLVSYVCFSVALIVVSLGIMFLLLRVLPFILVPTP